MITTLFTLLTLAMQATLAFVTVAQANASLIDEPREVVVRSNEEWRTLWEQVSPQTMPRVDFSGAVVVGVFVGTRPTAGYSVQIEAVRVSGTKAIVEYRERAPGPDAVVAQILTAPFHLIRIAGRPDVVEFRRLPS